MKEMRDHGIQYSNESNINAGRILDQYRHNIALVFRAIAFAMWLLFGLIFLTRLSGL
jgi:hypothetical protein